ncbi:hypothetical protein GCM10027286_20270 [Virgibacillus ainsalahensis]
MLDFSKPSTIRFFKLSIHSFFMMFIITFLSLLGTDLVGFALGRPIEKDTTSHVALIFFIIWFLFALQSDKYKKQDSK